MLRSVILFCLLFPATNAQTLVRKALVGLFVKESAGAIVVDSVVPHSTAGKAGIRKNDLLLSFNGQPVTNQKEYYRQAEQLRAGDEFLAEVKRGGGRRIKARAIAIARPLERSVIADIIYDWVPFRGCYLRAIVRKPVGKTRTPAILLIPGYGCGSIESYSKSYNGELMNAWLRNGFAVITVEKTGLGDSYGCLPCSEADLQTDIESYDAAYRYMKQLDYVDSRQLYIWGHSLGGMIAPEVAKKHNPQGVMVFGTVFRPWSEFLPEMHRIQKPLLENKSYTETENFARLIQKVYYEFFVLKRTREELFRNEEYRELVVSELEYKSGDNNMWGRHWRFWQQIDSLNLAKSWSQVTCPVLVLNGGTDYEQCASIEPRLIEETVNAARPGNATRIEIPDLDHFMMKSSTYREAADNFRSRAFLKGNFNQRIATETVNWLNIQTGKS